MRQIHDLTRRKVTYSLGGNETEIDFVLVEKQKVLERCQGDSLVTATQLVVVDVKKKNLLKRMKMKWNMQ